MKYWSWFAAKLLLAVVVVYGYWTVANWVIPPPPTGLLANWPRLGSDLSFTFAVAFACILAFGLVWLAAADQLYRCRKCVHRLRMPRAQGDYSHTMLGGTPFTEYICPYGHGKLYVPDVHLSSSRARRWTGYGNLWENLLQAELQDRG